MIKGLIFDIGGVLAYDVNEYIFAPDGPIVTKYHLDPQKVTQLSAKLWQKYAHTTEDLEENWQQLEQDYWSEFKQATGLTVPTAEIIELLSPYFRPVQHMTQFLETLKNQNLDLLICSNNAEFFYQRQKESAGFGPYVEKRKIILSCHYGVHKDEETFIMFKALEKQMDFPKEQYLFIDDRKKNIDAALKFGLTPIFFPAEAPYGHTYIQRIITQINT
jgi:HAD superfamily hydrolase (TIGR01509 family)